MEGTRLTLKIIESYNMKRVSTRPDYDDMGFLFSLPNGIDMDTLFVCNGEPCECDSLEGLDGWLYIETKEDLDKYYNMEWNEVLLYLKSEDDRFPIGEFIDD